MSTVLSCGMVGNDKDKHGCIPSAGYSWSELLQKCIRPFEEGMKFEAVDPESTSAAYTVFSADSLKVEIYMPEMKKNPILSKDTLSEGIETWRNNKSDIYLIRNGESEWVIYKNTEPVYISKE